MSSSPSSEQFAREVSTELIAVPRPPQAINNHPNLSTNAGPESTSIRPIQTALASTVKPLSPKPTQANAIEQEEQPEQYSLEDDYVNPPAAVLNVADLGAAQRQSERPPDEGADSPVYG